MGRRSSNEPDVKVHLTKGCELCSRTDAHTHSQRDWRELIDRSDPFKKRGK
jgi:hypothetical protein